MGVNENGVSDEYGTDLITGRPVAMNIITTHKLERQLDVTRRRARPFLLGVLLGVLLGFALLLLAESR